MKLLERSIRILRSIRTIFQGKQPAGKPCGALLCPAGVFALARLPCGVCAMVKALELCPESANRLRQMGIREGCRLSLVNKCDPLLVSVDNARIAVGSSLAEHIKVSV